MSLKVLFVAEKNKSAKEISRILSEDNFIRKEGFSKYNKIYEFSCRMLNTDACVTMTSVSGHLTTLDFSLESKSWNKFPPVSLFSAPIEEYCPEESLPVEKTLEREARNNTVLVVCTDCDREGEDIASQIRYFCQRANPSIRVYRARFSEITFRSITTAVEQLEEIDERLVAAVECRKELDLRIGAAFTRFLSLRLQKAFSANLSQQVISYGPCQFPALGFVVDRCKQVQQFVPEKYYELRAVVCREDTKFEISWTRGRLANRGEIEISQQCCNKQKMGFVYLVVSKGKSEQRPLPLDTVSFEKVASKQLNINAKQAMGIAEKLYTKGLISYPRTETDVFPSNLDLVPLIREQTKDGQWGGTAKYILADTPTARKGNKMDQAHPPIHPIKHTSNLLGEEKKVYEFIARHFLACCSKDAQGIETTVNMSVNKESFSASGLVVTARNYLDVYPYNVWTDRFMPQFSQGERVTIESVDIIEGETAPPSLLQEADLIALMDQHGIGTDATHPEHIEKIKARGYVDVQSDGTFLPTDLGAGLVEGLDKIGHNLTKPHLRAELERELNAICMGQKQKNDVTKRMIDKYKQVFIETSANAALIDHSLSKYFGPPNQQRLEYSPTREQHQDITCHKYFHPHIKEENSSGYPYPGQEDGPDNEDSSPRNVRRFGSEPNSFTNLLTGKRFTDGPSSPNKFYKEEFSVDCSCGDQANLLTVIKEGPNRGKKFYNCKTNSCDYFLWETSCDSPLNYGSILMASSPIGVEHSILCDCGNSAKLLTVRKQCANKGRQFYTCPKSRSEECGYFKWADEDQSAADPPVQSSCITSFIDTFEGNMSLNDSSHGILCECGIPGKLLTVKKDSPNKGREFYSCSKPIGQVCGFFQWADDSQSQTSFSGNSQKVICKCGESAKLLTVLKESPNKGREFYTCSKPKEKGCRFFQWADEAETNTKQSFRIANSEKSSHGVTCQCGLSLKLLTVRKESPNKGRKFYSCNKYRDKGCGYFQWADEGMIDSEHSFNEDVLYNTHGISCECGLSAKLLTVIKESASKGRQFYTCRNTNGRCRFFQWADEDTINTDPVIKGNESLSDSSQDIFCRCGASVKLLTVRKESPNKGRQFYSCPNPRGQGCSFFLWADEIGEYC